MNLTALEAAADEALALTLASPTLRVADVIGTTLLECDPSLPLCDVAQQMQAARCSAMVVVTDNRPVGIWTERDALALDFNDPNAFLRPVGEVMSQPVLTISREASLQEVVARFLQDRVRHYLVVDEQGQRCGFISQSDVVMNHGIEHYLHLRQVASVIRRPPITVAADESLAGVARLMRETRVDAVLVRYPEGEFGIVTERDLVRFVAHHRVAEPVGPLASRPVIAIPRDGSLYGARRLLLERRVRHVAISDEGGDLVGLISFFDIISGIEHAYVEELKGALEERDQALRVSRRSLHLAERVLESSMEGILITDADGIIESVNPAFTRVTGYSSEEVVGQNPSLLSSGRHDHTFYETMWRKLRSEGHWQGEIWNRRKSGEIYPELLTITAIIDEKGALSHYAALFNDITELKESEERIKHLAYYDPLTGLPNRRLLNDRLRVAIAHAHRAHGRLGILFIDLDRFKRINDSLGHNTGDDLLKGVAGRLLTCVREDDTVARMGGDEFIIILSELGDPEDTAVAARRVIEELKQPQLIQGKELVVTCSIGISIYPEDGLTSDVLLRNADTAMYRAKEVGRNSYQLYTPAMNARSLEHLALETGLRRAVERGELRVFYQPVVSAGSHRLVGAEALLRWQHPEMGLIPPGDFIPIAEESGLIIPIGEWVLRSACRQLMQWRQQGRRDFTIAVNLSPRQFREPGFVEMVKHALATEGGDPRGLELELTETMLMEQARENVVKLRELREMGIGIALDDFGTGYSSLSYLKRFAIDKLKIDRSFVRDIERSAEDGAIVSAVITLARSLGLQVVAEGVEEAHQATTLHRYGCDLLQGFLFGQPVPVEQFPSSEADGS